MDPLFYMVVGAGMVLSVIASIRVKGAFAKYSQLGTTSGMTGADVARRILYDNHIDDVTVEPVPGQMTDHYDPRTKILRLSEPVYGSNSMAAFGVAAHEVGHAIQHANGYAPLQWRSAWVPIANTGSTLSMLVIMGAFVLMAMGNALGQPVGLIGVLLFGTTTLFTLITLPVEFDASKRALLALQNGGYVTQDELRGAKKVLDAAAMTYVAAFVTSLLTLLYYAHRLGLFGNSRN
jgi:hypothetical protein